MSDIICQMLDNGYHMLWRNYFLKLWSSWLILVERPFLKPWWKWHFHNDKMLLKKYVCTLLYSPADMHSDISVYSCLFLPLYSGRRLSLEIFSNLFILPGFSRAQSSWEGGQGKAALKQVRTSTQGYFLWNIRGKDFTLLVFNGFP